MTIRSPRLTKSRRLLCVSGLCIVGAALALSGGTATRIFAQTATPGPAPTSPKPLEVKVGFLRQTHNKETISILDIPAPDDGFAGAELAAVDDNTTGRFLNQKYSIEKMPLKPSDDPVAALQKLVAQGVTLVLADLASPDLLKIADTEHGKDVLIFNTSSPDDSLRQENCRRNIIHIAPSTAMLTDGLAEYLIWKQWPRWLLIKGSHPADQQLADDYSHSAKKFGAKIVDTRTYVDTGGGRRSDSGSVQTQKLVPITTQNAPAYDVLIAADASEVFAGYLPYETWDPRPVAGSGGLIPTSWSSDHEQWGAAQLQSRFMLLNHRGMNARDNNAWVAMRMIGDAVARTNTNDPNKIHDYLMSPSFTVAAFKGEPLTLRSWDQQLRQPILLSDGRRVVSVSPQPGFLHQSSILDTLGYDKPETKCKLQ